MGTIRRRGVSFEFNDRDIQKILKGSEVRDALRQIAEDMASRARASAPVDSGEYRDSIHVETDETPTRARARVVASADHAAAVEAKTGNLKRALGG